MPKIDNKAKSKKWLSDRKKIYWKELPPDFDYEITWHDAIKNIEKLVDEKRLELMKDQEEWSLSIVECRWQAEQCAIGGVKNTIRFSRDNIRNPWKAFLCDHVPWNGEPLLILPTRLLHHQRHAKQQKTNHDCAQRQYG